jgi:SEC-C motif
MTPERNDPCWCGSGKKYKRCHLDHDRQRERQAARNAALEGGVLLDVVATRFGEVAEQMPNFLERVAEPVERLNADFRRRIGSGLADVEASEALKDYLVEIEAEFAKLAAGHSRTWWLYTTRRLEPSPIKGLMSLVDRRAERYPEFGGSVGAAIEVKLPAEELNERSLVALAVALNVSRASAAPLEQQFNVVFPGPTNYVPAGRSLEPVHNILRGFDKEVQLAYGVSGEALLATIWALSSHLARGLHE